jgi:hypothetical protein
VGREPERGAAIKAFLLSPALSSLLRREEREITPDASPEVTGRHARTKSGGFSPPSDGGEGARRAGEEAAVVEMTGYLWELVSLIISTCTL